MALTALNSPLLSIPGHIRNAIYRILLVSSKTIEPRGPWQQGSTSYPTYPYPQYRSSLAIAFTCKQVKAEALSIFYGINSFKFGSVEGMRKLLEFKDARQLLTRVEFNYFGHIRVPGFKALADLPNLQRLRINVSVHTSAGTRPLNLFKVRGLKQLKKVRGCKEVLVLNDKGPPASPYWKSFEDADVEKFGEILRK